jgi:hypothetical protein
MGDSWEGRGSPRALCCARYFLPARAMTDTAAEILDIYLASFLLARGATLISCDRADPSRVRFLFVRTDQLDYLVRLYWSGRATQVPACELFECLRHLQNLAARAK